MKKIHLLAGVVTRVCNQNSPQVKRLTVLIEVEYDIELSSKKKKIVLLLAHVVKAKDELISSSESITEKELNLSTHPRMNPHPRKVLLKLCTSTVY